ncbi:hypothetical protein G6O69_30630 [Pseudenhygromyxa sp. WMMC2535]|uniref:hypothetical protein n=1 Tax=Pseudenhygromyxa sp. WMMC2535 TaxID=2712867 RepID=UPI00155325FA|nr:hypothetical protein [Pseudenhygromyxa sp. WMMC2535]NVB42219.1 hypothetical protein [Pseudenhygromyxa sp. WMMC2535]
MTPSRKRPLHLLALPVALLAFACADDGDGADETSAVGTFDGLFDGVVTGFNFPFDLAIVPDDPLTDDEVEGGDIFVANYGTSEIMHASNPSGDPSGAAATAILDGTALGFAGAMAVSAPDHQRIWAIFEQGGEGDAGGLVILEHDGSVVASFDGADAPDAFENPSGLCFGGWDDSAAIASFYMINLGDGSAWRIDASDLDGSDASFTRVGDGLATGIPGNPGSPGNGLTTSSDLPQGGARGCAYGYGSLYVADAQNARVVRFDDAATQSELSPIALEDTPGELVTYPTDVTINADGYLIVISYDNAQAFVTLELPGGGFIDDGLQDLNVNAGNYGTAVAYETIWFTRANNKNGTLRAITPEQDVLPTTAGPFPAQ